MAKDGVERAALIIASAIVSYIARQREAARADAAAVREAESIVRAEALRAPETR